MDKNKIDMKISDLHMYFFKAEFASEWAFGCMCFFRELMQI